MIYGRHVVLFYRHLLTLNLMDWLTDILGRISNTPEDQLHQLLPHNWLNYQKVEKITPFREIIEIAV